MIEIRHKFTGKIIEKVAGDSLRRADLCGKNLREANFYGANLYGACLCDSDLSGATFYGARLCDSDLSGANLQGSDLRKTDLRGADLSMCKGILSFTGEKHLLVYFKYQNEYYFKIGCITKTAKEWLDCFERTGVAHDYGNNTKIYGDVIKLFSQYELIDKREGK